MRVLKMTRKLATIFAAGAIIFIVNEHISASSAHDTNEYHTIVSKPKESVTEKPKTYLNNKDWNILISAIINIESKGNDTAIGTTNDVGCIQATPIYVKEANRICEKRGIKKTFTLDDRKSRMKSIEMFNIIQSSRNKKRCLEKAARLHNPGAGQAYVDKVVNEYKRLKRLKSQHV